MGYCKPEVILGLVFSLKMAFLMKIKKKGALMSEQQDNDQYVEHRLFHGWKAAKVDHTFYSTNCKSTPPGTPSLFALRIEENRKKQIASAENVVDPRPRF
jgi:hypothetical protein